MTPNNGAERRRASREAMASMLCDATIRAVMSTIAHDVNQPLALVVTNANTGFVLAQPAGTGCHRGAGTAGADRWRRPPRRRPDRRYSLKFRHEEHIEPRAVSPCEVVADVVALLGDELESRWVAVRNEMPAGLPPVLAERARLALAFSST